MLAPGSSPHTRGAHLRQHGTREHLGIIPAYAGSTRVRSISSWQASDHPRIRGEHHLRQDRILFGAGSSPHTRGALQRPRRALAQARIIPAYAGSTAVARPGSGSIADHPRIRGEHHTTSPTTGTAKGSSPHTRGALAFGTHRVPIDGIIPAYAGSTSPDEAIPIKRGDHPRIRGEHMGTQSRDLTCRGSSPHTRGARADEPRHRRRERIIPAYAGST